MKLYRQYLQEIDKPDVLYHVADKYTPNILKPRVTTLGKPPPTRMNVEKFSQNAIYAANRPIYAFGLERVHIIGYKEQTRQEADNWSKSCWLQSSPPNLYMYYWNHVPTKPLYVYALPSDKFKPYEVSAKGHTENFWYCKESVVPLKVEKFLPNQVKKESWRIATDKEWEAKKDKYEKKGFFK